MRVNILQEINLCDFGQSRLNQWTRWARAQGPRIFFVFEGPQLAVVK